MSEGPVTRNSAHGAPSPLARLLKTLAKVEPVEVKAVVISFVYFAHTTLFALAIGSPDYETLWVELGSVYTIHGAVMIVGGSLFGSCTLRARVFPAWTAWLFLAGITMNLALGVMPLPDVLQTLGTTLRNAGLIGMGWALARTNLVLAS